MLAGRLPVTGGMTEWTSSTCGHSVTLGWDWVLLRDGGVLRDPTVPPRTNLLLIDERGYDCCGARFDEMLWQVIDAIQWQPGVVETPPENWMNIHMHPAFLC